MVIVAVRRRCGNRSAAALATETSCVRATSEMRVLVAEDSPRLAAPVGGCCVVGRGWPADIALDEHDARADMSPISSVVIVLDRDLSLVHGEDVSPQLAAPTVPAFW